MILIGIGGNLAGPNGRTPLQSCRAAAMRLDTLPGLRLRALSRWFQTNPIPPSCQPTYVNAVALLSVDAAATEPDPAVLLRWLQSVEAEAGRARGEPNAARTLDLDLIAMGEGGQMIRNKPDPILPHPRAHERAFVLVPLLDVAPGWSHPRLELPARTLLEAQPDQGVRII